MEIDVDLDDSLIVRATEISGITDINALVRFALEEMVRVEKERRERLDCDKPSGESG